MRQYAFKHVLAAFALSMIALSGADSRTQAQSAFGTNTPRPNMDPADFATNTPAQTFTPSASPMPSTTPTPTLTATATATPTATFTATPSPTPTPNGPFSYPEGISSLTGLPFPSEEARNRRNLIVKISNYPPVVRPQSGLNQADVVWEYEVEGGVTRFAAIFRSTAPDHVGPVRSGRLMDMNLVPMYEGLLAYSGASAPVQALLLDAPWALQIISPSVGDNCEEAGFCRFPQDGLAFEHTLYLDTNIAWERATRRGVNTGYRARGFAFGENPDPNGTPAPDVFIDWYGQTDARWQWDENAERFVRFTDGVAHFDAADGEQVWTDNIVILEVPHEERPDLFEEESNSASQQINLWGGGRALVFRDGQYYAGFWERRCRDYPPEIATPTPFPNVTAPCYSLPGDAVRLYYGSNQSILMKPGRTWVEVVRGLGNVEISPDTANMPATMTALAQSATPTATLTPTPGS
ncbi:MAG: DUF3048 domain-containing protein [bacterium]|nr:DUF3048 domain-containing protein [bacterium]